MVISLAAWNVHTRWGGRPRALVVARFSGYNKSTKKTVHIKRGRNYSTCRRRCRERVVRMGAGEGNGERFA